MRAEKTEFPKISIVTVNLNMHDGLEATFTSVAAQTYPNVEYLVIDGGSTDGSVDAIRENASRIDYWVSETDDGLYDAMNKGVRAASGEWIIFMNAGDHFHHENAVAKVFQEAHSDADLVYGHSMRWYAREQVGRLVRAESPAVLPLRMNCSHQSLFTRRSVLLAKPFSLGLMAADYEFLVRVYVEGGRFKMVDHTIGVNVNGGISDRKRLRSLGQRRRVAVKYGLMTPGHALSYACMASRAVLGPWLKLMLPVPLTGWLLRHRTFD
jgi:putative colanic acid biosynthesis glycosyltransferase